MIHRPPLAPTLVNRLRGRAAGVLGRAVRWGWRQAQVYGAIGPGSRAASRFGSFGQGTVIVFPANVVNPQAIHLGCDTVIAEGVTLSAGWSLDQPNLAKRIVTIGDRCLIGRGSTITGHREVTFGDDVWTGHYVTITDMNHGYEDLDYPISRQWQAEAPVTIGDRSWLGHGVAVLPGVHIGRHVVVGAGSVVTHDLPDHCVAVGVPAQVIRRHVPGQGWVGVTEGGQAPQAGSDADDTSVGARSPHAV